MVLLKENAPRTCMKDQHWYKKYKIKKGTTFLVALSR